MTDFANLKLPFDLPEIKKEHLPYAYGLIALGALTVVKNPKNIITIASAYLLWQNFIERGKKSL